MSKHIFILIAIFGIAIMSFIFGVSIDRNVMKAVNSKNIEYKMRDEFAASCVTGEAVPIHKIINLNDKSIVFQSSDGMETVAKHLDLIKASPTIPYIVEDGTYQICNQYYVNIAYAIWSTRNGEWISRTAIFKDKDEAWKFAIALNNNQTDYLKKDTLKNYAKTVSGVYVDLNGKHISSYDDLSIPDLNPNKEEQNKEEQNKEEKKNGK